MSERAALYNQMYGPSPTQPRIEIWREGDKWIARGVNGIPDAAAPIISEAVARLNQVPSE